MNSNSRFPYWTPGSTRLAADAATPPRPLDGAVPAARRSPAQLPDGSQQELVLLLRLWSRRRCHPLCRALPPSAVPASPGVAAPMAWRSAFIAGNCEFLSHAVAPPRRGGCLSAAPRTPLTGTDRANAHRLRAGRLPARWDDAVGLPAPSSAASRFGFRRGIRHLQDRKSTRLNSSQLVISYAIYCWTIE